MPEEIKKTEAKGDESKTSNTAQIKSIGREVYYFSDVTDESLLTLLEQLKQVDQASTSLEIEYQVPIRLYVCSGGGDLLAVLGFIDQLVRLRSPIHSVVMGLSASAATFITMACQKRFITRNSFILIHQFFHFSFGKYSELKDDRWFQDRLLDRMVEFYSTRSNYSAEQIRKMLMTHEAWFDAEYALKAGLVDEIL